MTPDINAANEYFAHNNSSCGKFAQYSSAYTVTNEDLRNALTLIPENAKSALTVAASGDHPMFTALCGIQHIDTFDITFNAKCIMDIKTTALQKLSRQEYINMLDDLYYTRDIFMVRGVNKIFDMLPQTDRQYLAKMNGNKIFGHGLQPRNYEKNLPTQLEYEQMRKTITQPFNFIWSGIDEIHKHLNQNYDFMHLSNIFDYITEETKITQILNNLMQHINPGGRILFYDKISSPLGNACRDLTARQPNIWQFGRVKQTLIKILQREK